MFKRIVAYSLIAACSIALSTFAWQSTANIGVYVPSAGGGGGGGGSVNSVTCGVGNTCSGTAVDPVVSSDTTYMLSRATAQSGATLRCSSAAASTTYTCTMTPALTAYTDGMAIEFEATATAISGPSTLDAGPGVVSIKQSDGTSDPSTNQVPAGQQVTLRYDGTVFRLPPAGGSSTSYSSIRILFWNSFSPAASTTYYYAGSESAATAENNFSQFICPITGTIDALFFKVYVGGTNSSAEQATHTVRINGVDSAVSVSSTYSGTTGAVVSDTSHTVAVNAGDKVTIKVVTPAWGTLPTGVRWDFAMRIRVP